ncbi:hypothetical protein [Ascidiaceihabitans sp.]|uniref:hypothetical protein n=1 Tax=Ascidiaceihabitans sp. TaxID=1872644 RepID=UPI003297ABFE
MSVCVECGDFELFYVPSCGDAAVGDSDVLLFAGDELLGVNAEIREMDGLFGDLDQANNTEDVELIVQAQAALAKTLDSYVKPGVHLPDKHLVQMYSLKGKRWTRVRSDKMANHWRRYRIGKDMLQPSGDQLPKSRLVEAFKEVGNKVKDDLQGGITFRNQIAKGSVSAGILELFDESWAKWIDAVNESMTYSHAEPTFDLSAGAQLLRAYAGFGVNLGYNPKKKSAGMSGHAEARAILAEAKATFNYYAPHRDGWHALIPYGAPQASEDGRQKELNFGYFRGHFTFATHAMLGASIFATAGVEYKAEPDGSILAKPSMAGVKGEAALGAFAGVEAGGSVKGALEWLNPGLIVDGQPVTNKEWGAIIEVGASLAGNFGVGAQIDFKITYDGGKLIFKCKAQLVVGLGAKGSLSGTIGFDKMYEFIMYLYNQLKDNDFSYLEFIDEGAFNFVIAAVLYAIEKGVDLARLGAFAVSEVLSSTAKLFSEPQAAEDYAKKIKARPSALIFAPPEAKGAILYRLSETYTFSFEEHQEAAILTVVGTVQSKAEWDKIVERITPAGSKSSASAGLARLNYIMDGGSQRKFTTLIAAINSLPPTTLYAGSPVRVQTIA